MIHRSLCMISLLALLLIQAACEPASRPQPTTLELWTLALRPTFDPYMRSLIAGFEQRHPDVQVVWVDVPFDAMSRKLIAAAAAGQAPDVVNFSDLQFARFAALGATRPIGDLVPGDPAERYLAGALRVARMQDQVMGLPWYLTPSVRLANARLLKAGELGPADLANDWDRLREQGRAYHAATGQFLFSLPLGEQSVLPQMMLADGLVPFAEDSDGRLVANLTGRAIVARVQAWIDFYRDGALPRAAATQGHAHLIELYQNGRLAMVQTGPNFLRRIKDVAPDVFAQTLVMPPVTGRLGRSHLPVMLLSVTSGSRHPKLAAQLAWWITSPQNQLAFARIVDILPSTPASLDAPHFAQPRGQSTDAQQKLGEARAIAAQSLPRAVAFTPTLESWPDLRRAFDERIKAALLEGASVQDTLASIEAEWNRILRAAVPATLDAVPRPAPAAEPGQATHAPRRGRG